MSSDSNGRALRWSGGAVSATSRGIDRGWRELGKHEGRHNVVEGQPIPFFAQNLDCGDILAALIEGTEKSLEECTGGAV